MLRRACFAPTLAVALALCPAAPARGETPVETARALVERYHEDITGLDRARDLLETALAADRRVDTLVYLSYVCYLQGDLRATTAEEKLAAYGRGRELGQRAVELAPRSHDAHLWYAINTGRWGQARGMLRAMFLLPTIREEIDILFTIDPRSVRAHSLAGNVFLRLPALFGGDRDKAEAHFKKALEIDPRYTVARVDLAQVHITKGRLAEARRELRRVLDEPAPTIVADWTVKDLPRARELLESIKDKR
ncbi:MAG: tetratricopeptide repeat protein [Candidatus Rokuibacteriota bacterium]